MPFWVSLVEELRVTRPPSLGIVKVPTGSVHYYLNYLTKCRELARKQNVSLRTLDRALWQWSKENGVREATCA